MLAESAPSRKPKNLEQILSEPEYGFLNTPKQRGIIDEKTEEEALEYISAMKEKRIRSTYRTEQGQEIVIKDVNPVNIYNYLEQTIQNSKEIGEGGDARVVIKTLPPFLSSEIGEEICYKFLKGVKIGEGRNDIFEELKIQVECQKLLQAQTGLRVGVPKPYFATSVSNFNVIGMERLKARTLGEIKSGEGFLPTWINLEELKQQVKTALDIMHSNGIYHRDLHEKNIMIPQTETPQDVMAYIIDFGLSTQGNSSFDPYAGDIAGAKLTFLPDHGILEKISNLDQKSGTSL